MKRVVLLLVDLLLVVLATVVALVLRDNLGLSFDRLQGLLPYLGATLLAASITFSTFGLNRIIWRLSALPDHLRVAAAVVLTVVCAVGLGFVFNRLDGVARSLPILQAILMVGVLVGARVLMRLRHSARRPTPSIVLANPEVATQREIVLVVGLNSISELFLRSIEEFAASRVQVAGLLGRADRHSGRLLRQHEILGTPEQLQSVLQYLEVHGVLVDRIVVTTAFNKLTPRAQMVLLNIEKASDIRLDFFAERIGLEARTHSVRAAMTSRTLSTATDVLASSAAPLGLTAPARQSYWRAKRILDIVGAACLIAVLAPVMALVALLVAIDVGLPTIFWQQRPGQGGRPFKLFKFRTMAAAHDQCGRRIRDEKRLSAIGYLLRRTRLDELPQLFNILTGDMSFVGPRPLLPVDQCQEHNYRLRARPGLTGWAQVNGGRDISPEAKGALDIWYVRNATLLLDLKIAWLTLGVLISGERPNASAIRQASFELRFVGLVGADDRRSQDLDESPAMARRAKRAAA